MRCDWSTACIEMYHKTIIGFGFSDTQNYQSLGKSYQPRLRLGILHITKTSSNNCLLTESMKHLI